MEILPGIDIEGLGLYLRKEKTLVVSDLHIGFEESMNKRGFLLPRLQLKRVSEELEKMLKRVKPKRVVLAGDLKQEFGGITEQEWRDTLKVLDLLAKHTDEIVLIKGNHDTILGPIAEKRKVKVVDYLLLSDCYITHGDKLPEDHADPGIAATIKSDIAKAKTIIIGHEHPAIGIREKSRLETFKCFLLGKWKRKNLIVLPSMHFISEGTDILQQQMLSPFFKSANIRDFEVFVVGDETYPFGTVRDLLRR